jgi:hypothetical protein
LSVTILVAWTNTTTTLFPGVWVIYSLALKQWSRTI